MQSKEPQNNKTYVATVRVDIRTLAKIARFLAQKGVFLGTKGRLASEGLRIISDNLSIECETFREAVLTLTELGYENPKGLGTRCEKQIARALEAEASKETLQNSIVTEVSRQVKEFDTITVMPSKEAKEATELTAKETTDVKSLRNAMETPTETPNV